MSRARGGQRPWLLRALAGLVLLSLVAGPAQARRRRPPLYRISTWRGEVATELRYDRDDQKSTLQPETRSRESLLTEEVSIGADGWVYHPALLDFSAQVDLLLDQDKVDFEPGALSSRTDRNRLGFDVDLEVLPDKPYPISLFASRAQARIDVPLAPQRTIDTFHYGAGLSLPELSVSGWEIPARLDYQHQETQTSGSFGTDQTRNRFDLVLDNRTERARNRLDYEWDSRQTTSGSASRTSNRHQLDLSQDLDLDRGALSSRFTLTDDSLTGLDLFSLSLVESLIHQYSETLSSNASYSLVYQDTSQVKRTSHSGSFGLSHRLYQSLFSTIGVSGNASNGDNGRLYQVGGNLGLHYTKKIPWGQLGLRYSPSYSYQKEDLEEGIFSIVDEEHPVSFGDRILLEKPFVFTSTITLVDPDSGGPVNFAFVPRSDAWTELRITETFLPAAVSVSYDYQSRPSRTFTTNSRTSGFSLNLLDHWSFDLTHSQTDQDLVDGFAGDNTLEDSESFRARLDSTFVHNRTHMEFERIRSEINPRRRYGITHTLSLRPAARATLSLTASYDHDELTDTDRVSDSYSLGATGTTLLVRRVRLSLDLLLRRLDQEEEDSRMAGGAVSLDCRYGRLRFQLQGDLTWSSSDAKTTGEESLDSRSSSVRLRVSRPF